MAENQNRLWASYVKAVAGDQPAQAIADQIEAAVGQGVSQPTVSRWLRGAFSGELKPGNVAAFAQAFDRPVLEAFVAADLLGLDDAQPGLDDESAAFVIRLERDVARLTRRADREGHKPQPRPRRA